MPTTLETRPLSPHPQRPWRAVQPPPRRAARTAARTFYAPVVRELPPRAPREPVGTW
jgi:hypothetical protein